jgi:hypothetical protein
MLSIDYGARRISACVRLSVDVLDEIQIVFTRGAITFASEKRLDPCALSR